jgi:hypothetical protein
MVRHRTARNAATATLVCLLCTAASGQWINYPTHGIPRTSDGKPNLSAPAPKTADGKPDFSGVWEQLNARTSAYYLKGIDIPWQPWAKALYSKSARHLVREWPARETFCRSSL